MFVMNRFNLFKTFAILALTAILASGCATRPPADDPQAVAEFERNNDPLEPMNRATFQFNMAFDRYIMRPIAVVYRAILPSPVRVGITNFLDNISSPFIFANDVLQGEPDRAATTLMRFVTNTTVGIGGIMDPASKWGYEKHNEDFGETLAVWGAGESFYLVLPFLGPSNPRDAVGWTVRFFAEPTDILIENELGKEVGYSKTALEIIDFRSRNIENLDNLEANSADLYTAMRSAYRQNRAFRINNGKAPIPDAEDDLFSEEFTEDPYE